LDETYERVLKEIGMANRENAYRLLQCLTVAIRPLRIKELAEILALDFDGAKGGIPELKEDWRWKDQQEAVLSTCSSLIAVVNDGSHRVVQFSHFSVKEFLTSNRLATSSADISHFHILLKPAHTVVVKACLGILLRSDNGVGDAEAKNNSPLAKYAAEHWVGHALFEMSTHLQVEMRHLFDPAMPYFEAWLELYDIDSELGWTGLTDSDTGKQRGAPLYYASLCGFRDLAAHLVAKHPQHVNSTLGRCLSPLGAALHRRHFDIAELLYQNDADVGIRSHGNWTLMHAASMGGDVDIVQWLLDRCVDAHSQQDVHGTPLHLAEANGRLGHCKSVDPTHGTDSSTPLHLASRYGHFEIVRLLIEHGVEVTSQNRGRRTPLHLASSSGSPKTVRVLIEHGAEVTLQDQLHWTPLHLASSPRTPEIMWIVHGAEVTSQERWYWMPPYPMSSSRSAEIVRVLIAHGAEVNSRVRGHRTPLHLASSWSAETVRVLVEHGADVNARDGIHKTPLHLALSLRSAEIVRLLIEHGADVNARDGRHITPLHLASSWGSGEIVRVLIEHGADVNARDGIHETPLHLASSSRSAEIVRLLIEHGADVNAKDWGYKMPLHLASSPGSAETVRVLTEHGADVNARDWSYKTPLHLASSSESAEAVRVLVEHGVDVDARDGGHKTPLHLASSSGSAETVQVLIEHGADVNTRDGRHITPLHLALSSWRPETVRLLLKHGADVNAQDGSHKTPLHLASSQVSVETV